MILYELEKLPGSIGFYYKNLTTGEKVSFHSDKAFESASVIKLPIYAAVQKLAAEGIVSWDEKLLCRDEDKKPSCGALQFFPGSFETDIRTLCALMITISDNTATNLLIRRFGIDFLNGQFEQIGLIRTHLERFLFDSEASARGRENRFAPAEVGLLLERIANREFLSPQVSNEMLALLKKQQIKHKIQGYLPHGTAVAHKTGEDAGITNDVGIVFAPEPFVVCFASNRTNVPAAERFLRQASLDLFRHCGGIG
ncbi:MAG: serine hydrolase [Oscillospiraceae bacterium]|nr:serine hydrolase [Oscillospiraceae bacterium]